MAHIKQRFSHFFVLLNKNFILWRRSIISSLLEILIPIAFVSLLILLRTLVLKSSIQEQSYIDRFKVFNSSLQLIPGTNLKKCPLSNPIAISPNNTFTRTNIAPSLLSLNYSLKYFMNESDIDDYVRNDQYSADLSFPPLCFAIVIEETGNSDFNIRLRFNNTGNRDTEVYSTLKPSIDTIRKQLLSELDKFEGTGFLGLTNLISTEILKNLSSNNNISITTRLQSVRMEQTQTDDLPIVLRSAMDVFIVLPLLITFLRMTFKIIYEKENRLRENMRMMGLKTSTFYGSWIALYSIVYLVITITNTFILQATIMQNTNGFIIWIVYFLFCLNLIALSLLISVFFTRVKIGMLFATGFFFVLYFVRFIIGTSGSPGGTNKVLSKSDKIGASFSPHTAVAQIFEVVLALEGEESGITFSNIDFEFENYSVLLGIILQIVTILLYGSIAFYLDQVFPNEFGKKRRPLFFLEKFMGERMKKFEKKMISLKKKIIGLDFKNENVIFEDVDMSLKQQEERNEILIAEHIFKAYSNGTLAVKDLSLKFYKGQISALLGPNGAGKTTFLSILTGLYEITKGKATIFGKDVEDEMDEIRTFLGYCPQFDVLFEDLTIYEHLKIYGTLKGGMSRKELNQEIDKMLEDLNISDLKNAKAKNLSGGNRRMISVAIALIGNSKFVLLDEPTSGLDTSARRNLWEMLKNYKTDRIIILTTHMMDEADYLGDRIAIMGDGTLKVHGSSLFLKNKLGVGYNLTIQKSNQGNSEKIISEVTQNLPKANFINENSSVVLFQLPIEESNSFEGLFKYLESNKNNLGIESFGVSITTLEDVFIKVAQGNDMQIAPVTSNKLNKKLSQFSGRIEDEELSKIQIKNNLHIFLIHFKAMFFKRYHFFKRDLKGLIFEIALPIALIIFGIYIVKRANTSEPVEKEITSELFGIPFQAYYSLDTVISTVSNVISLYDSKFNWNFLNSPNISDFDNQLWLRKSRDLRGGIFFNTANLSNSTSIFDYSILYNTIGPEIGPLLITKTNEAISRMILNKNISINIFNSPFPLTALSTNFENYQDSGDSTNIFGIGLSFIPAAIIIFIVRERKIGMKHQHFISGYSIVAYWLSNLTLDLIKYYITAFFALAFIQIGNIQLFSDPEVYSVVIALFVLYGPSLLAFTYVISFFFDEYGNAQLVGYFLNYLTGGLMVTIWSVLFVFESTRDFSRNSLNYFRIFPSFAFTDGLSKIGNRKFYPILEGKFNVVYDPMDTESAFYDVVYLSWTFGAYFLLIFVIEFINSRKSNLNFLKRDIPKITKPFEIDVAKENRKVDKSKVSDFIIRCKHIRKIYNDKAVGVDDVSFGLDFGETFGLLGVNGSGKTSTFKMLTLDIATTSGDIHIMKYDISREITKARVYIGYSPQFVALLDNLTPLEHLQLFGDLKGIPRAIRDRLIQKILVDMNLQKYQKIPAEKLSGGNRKKLSVALSILGNPPIILLDEPSTGMDPQAKRFIWSVITNVSTQRKRSAVILSTNSMEEAEALCSRIGIMVKGRFETLGSVQQIKSKYGKGYEIEFKIAIATDKNIQEFLLEKGFSTADRQKIKYENLKDVLNKMDAGWLNVQINYKGFGSLLFIESSKNDGVSLQIVAEFVLTETAGAKSMEFIEREIGSFFLIEHYQSYYRVRVEKKTELSKLFGAFEKNKESLRIVQYSIQQASIEQIFNMFANNTIKQIYENGEEKEEIKEKDNSTIQELKSETKSPPEIKEKTEKVEKKDIDLNVYLTSKEY